MLMVSPSDNDCARGEAVAPRATDVIRTVLLGVPVVAMAVVLAMPLPV